MSHDKKRRPIIASDGKSVEWCADDLDPLWVRSVRRNARRWFARHARAMPWRSCPDPYRVWISEIMLQQTQVATVIPYFDQFVSRFPDVVALAAAEEQDVLRCWEGLGYYRRARNLHRAACEIVENHHGRFPLTFQDVRGLPGIGRYTAGAILSIGCGQPHPVLEGNTIRLYCRLTGFDQSTESAAGQRYLWGVASRLTSRTRPGELNQALMEIGSEVCRRRHPACTACPLKSQCVAFAQGSQFELPRPRSQPVYEDVLETAYLVSNGDRYLVRQCPDNDRWPGLWDFPRFAPRNGTRTRELGCQLSEIIGVTARVDKRLIRVKHAVTRFRITLDCYRAMLAEGERLPVSTPWLWRNAREIEALPLSMTGRKIQRELID